MRTPAMKLVLFGLVMCLSFVSNAQDDGTVLLRRAAHCLAAKNFLPPSKARETTFGYLLDEKSYPGEKMLYVVEYPKPSRADGFVFTIFLTDRDGSLGFNIQNNARFTSSKDSDRRVSFATPPLGGYWATLTGLKRALWEPSALLQHRSQGRFPRLPRHFRRRPDPGARTRRAIRVRSIDRRTSDGLPPGEEYAVSLRRPAVPTG